MRDTPALDIPAEFAALVARRGDGAGKAWLDTLPEQAAAAMRRWSLTPDGPSRSGFCAVVVPVRTATGDPAVLKIGWPHPEGEHEALALRLWDGDGAVRLYEVDGWSMLLERLDADTDLRSVPLDEALAVVTGLLRRLDRPAPPQLLHVSATAERWTTELPAEHAAFTAAGGELDRELVERAVAYCRELGPVAGSRLVNEDMHYENVLAAEREPWLLIDPKPMAGDPEFGLIPLLWNRTDEGDLSDRLDVLVEATGMDRAKARKWTFVRAVECRMTSDESDPAFRNAEAIIAAVS